MYWVLLDVAFGVLAVTIAGLTGFSLYRHVRTLTRAVGASSATLADASSGLNSAQATGAQRR
jgi:hypothetical protein